MTYTEFDIPSSNGYSILRCWTLTPTRSIRGILQIVHGLGCHSGRYSYMARKACDAGFLVCADDHVGHGKTALRDDSFGQTGSEGWKTFVEDEHLLRKYITERHPGLPYMMFGHSMGSMICRLYASAHPEMPLHSMALGGICQQNPGAEPLLSMHEISDLVADGYGQDRTLSAKYFSILMGKANERFPGEDASAWLSAHKSVREDYASDPLNNHVDNSLDMLHSFVELYRLSTDPRNDAAIPASLPLLLMGGDQDPCGNYGEGLYNAANSLIATGHQVECIAWTGHRHEIHNDPDIRDHVIGHLMLFFAKHLSAN